jgi:hypothetical protein
MQIKQYIRKLLVFMLILSLIPATMLPVQATGTTGFLDEF